MSATPLLSVRHANKHYGGTPVLVDAALDLLPGEVHALMGENGAGKSTLIKILAGVVSPDRAEIALHSQAVNIANPQMAFDLGLRFIHQELAVVPQLSVAENLFLSHHYPRRAGFLVDWRQLNQSARAVLDQLGIAHIDPRTRMARLGTGDQMLVKIASAFVAGDRKTPAVYIMDEPTAALTSKEVTRLFGVIRKLKLQGCAVLYVSHRMEEIFQIADRVTVMRDGRMVGSALTKETSSEKLIRLMTGRELSQTFPVRETPVSTAVVLAVRDLATDYVREVNFDLRAGEILGLAGLAGAGCTELLRALVGADPLRAGEIRLDGETRTDLTPVSAWERGFAYVPEERRSQGLILS
ncbi:MAG: sugar ABC transporter ATP-binding protein, partial [Anaerolineae bacterium]|nr:sugar ABC transporter ATP-binding protein [Anaerolineae bacterium]